MRFQRAVRTTRGLEHAWRPGLQALVESDRRRIEVDESTKLSGSVELDKTLKKLFPNDSRWDYGVACRRGNGESITWIEIHPATDGDAKTVHKKFKWLRDWLRDFARELGSLPREFIWISSGKTTLSPASPRRKRLAQMGVRIVGRHFRICLR